MKNLWKNEEVGEMSLQEIKNQISKMKTDSEEFYSLYDVFMDKYFGIDEEELDDYMKCKRMIFMWLSRSTNKFEDQVIVTAKIVQEIFTMYHKKQESCTGTLAFDDMTYFFDIYTKEDQKDYLNEMILAAGKNIENGKFKIKNKAKKNKYFNRVRK